MKKILFNGCSVTWGDELKNPQQSRFSKIVSDKLNYEEINISLRGASNDRIFRTTIEHIAEHGYPDIAIIMWSGLWRSEFYDRRIVDIHKEIFYQVAPTRINSNPYRSKRKELEMYYSSLLTDETALKNISTYMLAMQEMMKCANVPLLQLQYTCEHRHMLERVTSSGDNRISNYIQKKYSKFEKYSTTSLYENDDIQSLAGRLNDIGPGSHPLEKSHGLYADYILEQLKEHYDIGIQ